MTTTDPADRISKLRVVLYEAKTLEMVPILIAKIIDDGSWREFYDEVLRDVVHHATFESFVRTKPPEGLGIDPDWLWRICAKTEAQPKLEQLLPALSVHGGPRLAGEKQGDNVTLDTRGNDRAYTLSRLKRDAPQLADQVIAGELSANAAAIKAGFRAKKVQVEPTFEGISRLVQKYLPGYELVEVDE